MNPRVTLPEEMWKRLQQKCFGVVNLRAWIAGTFEMAGDRLILRPGIKGTWEAVETTSKG